jgi:hypothetical protein
VLRQRQEILSLRTSRYGSERHIGTGVVMLQGFYMDFPQKPRFLANEEELNALRVSGIGPERRLLETWNTFILD